MIPGTVQVTGQIAPTDPSDTFPTHDVNYGKGGFVHATTTVARDNIPAERRRAGMFCFVDADGLVYQLALDLVTWAEFTTGTLVHGDLTGRSDPDQHPLDALEGGGASTGQVVAWTGSVWAPANPEDLGYASGVLALGLNVVDLLALAVYGAADWSIELAGGSPLARYKAAVHVTHDGSVAYLSQDGVTVTPGIGIPPFVLDADVNAGDFRFIVTATAPGVGWTYNVRRISRFTV
jgi:hypothetical protein